jgi:hypothetical protein
MRLLIYRHEGHSCPTKLMVADGRPRPSLADYFNPNGTFQSFADSCPA